MYVGSVSYSIAQILEWTGGRLANEASLKRAPASIQIKSVSGLKGSRVDQIAFFFSAAYKEEIPFVQAGALITGEAFLAPLEHSGLPIWQNTAIIACQDPYEAMALISEKFAAFQSTIALVPQLSPREGATRIHASAVVHPSAKVGLGAEIGAHCVVEKNSSIGARTTLYAGCFVGPGCKIGDDTVLFPNVVVYEWCEIGDRVRIHANSVIGGDGFGYAPRIRDGKITKHVKIYHLGRVVIGSDVEIGATTCVDRGTLMDTVIGDGVKIDNNVQIGHNVKIGEGSVICGNVAMAGSSTLGKWVYVAGLAAVNNGIVVHDGARVGPATMVLKDIPSGEERLGFPPRLPADFMKIHSLLNRMLKEHKVKEHKISKKINHKVNEKKDESL